MNFGGLVIRLSLVSGAGWRRAQSAVLSVLLCVVCTICAAAVKQPHNLAFEHIYSPDGEVGQRLGGVHAISQDPHGFMWFGGEDGLVRFDGIRSRLYQAGRGPGSLNHNFVRRLLHDAFGEMWIATEQGICRYHERTDHFECPTTFAGGAALPSGPAQALVADQRNFLYVGSREGVYAISPDRTQLKRISLPLESTGKDFRGLVVDMAVDHEGQLWVATEDSGLFRYSPNTDYVRHYYFNGASELINPLNVSSNRLKCLAVDHRNRVWIGYVGSGLSVLDAGRDGFTHYRVAEFAAKGLSSDVVWDIFEDSERQVWVAVDQAGLVLFDESAQQFISYRHRPYDPSSIQANQLRTMYEDKNGDLWLGLFPYGVNFHNRATRVIQNYRHEPDNPFSISHSAVLNISADQTGALWVGTEDGLNQFDPYSGRFHRFQQEHDIGLSAKAVLATHPKDDGGVWVGTWSGGLFEFAPSAGRFKALASEQMSSEHSPSLFIWDIVLSRDNQLLVATEYNGLNILTWPGPQVRYVKRTSADPERLPHNFVWDVEQTRDGTFWLATQGGLIHLDQHFNEIERFTASDGSGLESERVLAVFESRSDKLWLGTQDRGAAIYDRDSREFQYLTGRQGLPANQVSGFVDDADGRTWILTSNGLARYDYDTAQLKTLRKPDGLIGNNFNRKAAYRGEDGTLYIGGTEGLSVFHPNDIFQPAPEFDVKLTELRLFNEPVPVNAHGPLQQSIVTANQITLEPWQNMFALDFAALSYRNLSNIEYLYRLEGFDKHWNAVRDFPSATYTNIEPGKYTFKVRANRDGRWVDAPPLDVVVLPAWWHSGWAIAAYVALGLMVLGFIVNHWRLHMRTAIYRDLSRQDALTGLRNRAGLMQEIEIRYQVPSLRKDLCFIFMDVDHFKRINDNRGHQVGDQVLKEVAEILLESIRQADIPARWGGEEFLLMCVNVKPDDAHDLAEKIRANLASHTFCSGLQALKVTASFGVAVVGPDESFQQTFKRVDDALYRAKGAGRNCVMMAGE